MSPEDDDAVTLVVLKSGATIRVSEALSWVANQLQLFNQFYVLDPGDGRSKLILTRNVDYLDTEPAE